MSELDNELAKLKWQCRRGMLELDVILMPFLESHYSNLSEKQKVTFIKLLEVPDPDLYNWLMGYKASDDGEIQELIHLIRKIKFSD